MAEFVHLHNHSHYSLLDALPTIGNLIDYAHKDGHPAVALTDHGVMFGALELYKLSKKKGIKPIVGMEAYVANGSRLDKTSRQGTVKRRNYFHLILLAKDQAGYNNLLKLTSLAHTEGQYYKPRVDKELLEKYKDGLIALSACMGGVINAHLVDGNYDIALSEAQYYKDLYGDDFYIEIQNHFLEHDPIILRDAPKIARELGLKLIATNDIHYMEKKHAQPHNLLLSIRDADGNFDVNKLRYGTAEYYFKTSAEMENLFKDFPESISNTLEVADKCDLTLDFKITMPQFPIPTTSKSTNLDEYLEELVWEGVAQKYDPITDIVKERAKFELNVITSMGFPGYFLIVWDFIRAARELGVRVGPGRGSAAGSLVAYALGITNVDPLPYDLLFERFLNPERVSMPDIDIDFQDDKRDIVINYVKEKYGEEAVAQIVTFGKLMSRAVLSDVGRVLGVELSKIKEITALIPVFRGKVKPLNEAIELPELSWLKNSKDEKMKQLIEYSLSLEGKIRSISTHAAGVVIAPGDITDFVPIYQSTKSKGQSVEIASQFSMNDLEDAGLLKMDFLGLRTLSIIDNTLTMIKENHKLDIDIDEIDFFDEKTYNLLSEGHTLAVFQFESQGMQEYLKRLKPRNLEELTAMNALYRPGPMDNIPEFIDRKFERKPITYLHPIMEKVLKTTYGIIVYQEQVMLLVQVIADFSLGQADILRRAMGKKKIKEMDNMKPLFVEGAARHGISKKLALEIFDLIYKFADYGFNKSHSLAYSYLAFQTAWLKANYPAEFLAANMTAELNNQEKIVQLIDEAKKFRINVLPPNINVSRAEFIARDNMIFFGLAGIKNVGVPAVESIVIARQEKMFDSFFDFVLRVDNRLINKRTIEALICAGAFDSLRTAHRAALVESIELALEYSKSCNDTTSNIGMSSLFGDAVSEKPSEPKILDAPEWPEHFRLQKEKEVVNFYVSGHPLNKYEVQVKSLSNVQFGLQEEIMKLENNQPVRICGMVSGVRTRRDKKDRMIAFAMLEDFSGKAECIFWSDGFDKFGHLLVQDAVLVCSGKASLSEDNQLKVVVDDAMRIEDAVSKFTSGFKIWIDLATITENDLMAAWNELKDDRASTKIDFYVRDDGKNYYRYYSSSSAGIRNDIASAQKLAEIFGIQNVRLII